MPENDRLAYLATIENEDLHAAELAKQHPLVKSKFSKEDLVQLKSYLLDGGGVIDDSLLVKSVMQALMDDDFDTLLREMPHVVKAWLKQRGALAPLSGGMVAVSGFAPTTKPEDVPKLSVPTKE